MKPITIAAFTFVALALTACGKQTVLERPGPLFGRASPRADTGIPNAPSKPGSVKENMDPATSSATTRQARMPGTNPDPFSGPSGPGFPNSGPGRQ